MQRIQLSVIASKVVAAGISAIRLTAVRSGTNDIAFRAQIDAADDESYQVADDAGKLRTFRDADDFFKQAGALSMIGGELVVNFEGMALVAPKAFTGDIIKKNRTLVESHKKRMTLAKARCETVKTAIALMQSDPTVPQSLKDERAAQVNCMLGLIRWLGIEIARIEGLLNPEVAEG